MNHRVKMRIVWAVMSLAWFNCARAEDFFAIRSATIHQKPTKKDFGIWQKDPARKKPDIFIPSLEVRVETAQQTKAKDLKEMDESFDEVAKAWELGVKQLGQKYGIPQRNFMLWGISGSAQWAYRLALRKPDCFLAIHVHVSSSFDQATPEARKVLWLLSTGEMESGYERAKRFYAECRKLGYPIMFKAIVGLGHAGSPIADQLGLVFYEYALTMQDRRAELDEELKKNASSFLATDGPWPMAFRTPEYFGDIVNQEVFPFRQREMIPEAFQTPLPTKELAEAWNK